MKAKIAVAISGAGRSLQNFLSVQGRYQFEVGAVISSNPLAPGNQIATDHQLPLLIKDFSHPSTTALEEDIQDFLHHHQISLLALAGFLKPFPLISSDTLRVVNIHPSLLPKYSGKGMYGKRVHQAVCENQEAFSGASIHYVNEHYDEGELIAQEKVQIPAGSSWQEIAEAVFQVECQLYPETINQLLIEA